MHEEVREAIGKLLDEQSLGVLATCRDASPYLNLVAFSPTADLTGIIFATGRATRK